jgi:hypothetical protein
MFRKVFLFSLVRWPGTGKSWLAISLCFLGVILICGVLLATKLIPSLPKIVGYPLVALTLISFLQSAWLNRMGRWSNKQSTRTS